jgi:hypothetical protein
LGNTAAGENSHAEGDSTQAIGLFSHAEGLGTIAYGGRSHAEGRDTLASGSYSHAEGYQTIALGDNQHVQGQYNFVSPVQSAFIVGNGIDDSNRNNLIYAAENAVEISGSLNVNGSLIVNEIIKGTGSIYLQPDVNDSRKLQIYNTGATDVHIKGTTGLTFLGNDINNVKIDDYYKKVSIDTPNGVYVSSSLNINWNPSSLKIGDSFQGGKIAYLYTPGDGGYDPNLVQGVIAAEADEPTTLTWDDAITAVYNKTTNEYDDWFLPNIATLGVLYTNKVAIGGFVSERYWSSEEFAPTLATQVNFLNGIGSVENKTEEYLVRAVRNFSIPINALNINGNTVLSGSLKVSGSVKLSTTDGAGDSLDLIIGQTNTFGPTGYQINASGSTENTLFLISNLASGMVAQGTVSNPGDTSLFTTQVVGYVNNGGPEAQLQLYKSGSVPAIWVYDYNATSNFPGDINIGYDNIIGTTSGSLNIRNGNINLSGSINVTGSIYKDGNKQFNYGQWASLETQTGSANTAYAMKLEVPVPEFEGIYVGNNGSGFPTRIYVENNGLYNIQFSAQLHTTSNESCDFSVWFAMTGSNIANSNTDFSIEKVSGGGFQVAALNFLTPITSGSYVELYWSKTTANGQLQAKGVQSTPTRPATPSVIVTVTQVA